MSIKALDYKKFSEILERVKKSREIKKVKKEVIYRVQIGRLYYSAYHYCQNLLGKPNSADRAKIRSLDELGRYTGPHKVFIGYIRFVRKMRLVSERLLELFYLRQKSDYNLRDTVLAREKRKAYYLLVNIIKELKGSSFSRRGRRGW